jgi:DNA-binding transcriptional MerR regulator
MRRRKDTYVKANSIADIQELMTIAKTQKEYHEDRIRILKKRIEDINRHILVVREDFLSFLTNNGIDVNYPVFNAVSSDDIVPSTVSEPAMSAVPIEEAMLPNIPNITFLRTINLLRNKYGSLQDEIEEYHDTLSKMRLKKSHLEATLESVQKSIEEYQDNIKENQQEYNDSVKNLDKIKSLYQNLLEFKSIITAIPDNFTVDSYIKFQNNYFDRYSTIYYDKKNSVKKFADILQDTYKPTPLDQMEEGFYTTVFRDISIYFGPFDVDNLQDKYVDAIPHKKDILIKLQNFSGSLDKLISNVKMTIDLVRGIKGIGNSVVDGLVNSANEISKSFVAENKVEHTTLESVSSNNFTINIGVNQNISNIKDKLQLGVENLDDKFIRTSGKYLRKIALFTKFPKTFLYDRNINIEDCVREKVRRKYGGDIPFCDEIATKDVNGNRIFVKRSELDPKTGTPTVDMQTDILEKKTRTTRDVLSS